MFEVLKIFKLGNIGKGREGKGKMLKMENGKMAKSLIC